MAFQDFYNTVQKLYIAYYQRPADAGGLRFWAQMLEAQGGSLEGIIDAFATSAEAASLYDTNHDGKIDGNDNLGALIDAIYQALFNRAPDAAGKQFYLNALQSGQFPDGRPATPGRVALDILNGAQGSDQVAVANKLQVANAFTQTLDPDNDGVPPYQATYSGDADAAQARAFLAQVTSDPTTVKTQSQVTEFIQSQIANPGDPILSVPSGQTFTLTSNTAVLTDVTSSGVSPAGKLTSANDTIEALNNLGNSVVIKDASTADNDTLKVILTAAAAPLVQNIENIELTVTNSSADLQMTNITGTKNVVLKGDSTADGKVSALPTSGGPTIVLDAGYAKTLTLAQTTDAGTSDSLTVKLNGTGAKAGLTINDGDNSGTGTLETLNLISDGATNTLTVAVDGTNTSAVGNTVITGSKDLTLIAAADDMLSGTAAFQKIDATGHTGQLTLQIGDTSAATAIADTAISLTNYKGVDRVVLNDDTVVTVSDAASGIVVDANSDAAFGNFTISGNSTVAATASNADVATLNLTSKTGTIMSGTVTFTGFETLIINSTNVNHTITGALTTSGSPTALDTVKIGGNKDLTLSAAPSGVEKIDATGFTGKLIMAAAGASMLEIVGGDGSDTIYGGGNTSSPTVVNMGKGDDTYVIGAQSDVVTGGDGADTFNATTLANTKLVSGVADKIMDFTSGTDKIKVGTTIDGNTTDTTLAVQTLTWNTDLATTLGGGTYAADTAYFVKISGGSADGNYYLILNDSTPAFSALADGVIQIVGATSLTAADIIA